MKWAILTLISIFLCVCCAQMLEWDSAGNLVAHSYSIWGDWSAHFSFISNLKERGLHWLVGDNPVFYGAPFQYPFLSHVLTAFLSILTGMSVIQSTFLSSLLLLAILPFSLNYFFESLGLSRRQSIVSVILFLFLGGFQIFDSSLNPADPLTNQMQAGSVFTQIVLFELFPQRAFLFGMNLFCFGLGYLVRQQTKNQLNRKKIVIGVIGFALLAWVHLHSWIAMGVFLLMAFLITRNRKIFIFGASVALISLPLILFLLRSAQDPSLMSVAWQKWFPGWAQNVAAGLSGAQEMNPFSFWIYNTGLFLVLAGLGIVRLKRNPHSSLLILALSGTLIFAVAELFNIQPYFYDNLKLFTYAFLFLSPLAALSIDFLLSKKVLIPLGVLILGVQSASALRDDLFFFEQKQTASFFTSEELELAQEFKRIRRSPDSLVVISPVHNHWVPAVAGNPVLMGYPGWLWTWGIQYSERELEVNEILKGGPRTAELLARYPVEYIIVNDHEVKTQFSFPRILQRGSWSVYQVK